MKLVNESLNEFQKGLDPVDSLGLGRRKMIEDWLKSHNIENYTITSDYMINVSNSVDLEHRKMGNFPEYIQFNKIQGFFDVRDNDLTSLRGCPYNVNGFFSCSNNKLKTLEYAPKSIIGDFTCNNNKLISLKGCVKEIMLQFSCEGNKLTSLEYAPENVGTSFNCKSNSIQFTEKDVRKVCKVKGTIYV